ncbi:hypothetical protein B5807_03400 [Epicoccum nigrum]|uniref:Protein kinase domain-containing protein n=1 Tax=Epicoccum nigrum TaxID=105696 RepID=A0A1Y2M8L8_EPING|nr:hypothetical protein B5807_03400 [Epicoccum nigrum]
MHLDMQPPNVLLDLQAKKRKSLDDEVTDAVIAGPSKRQKSGEEREVVPQLADFGFSFFDLDFGHNPELDENPYDHILPLNFEHNHDLHRGTRLNELTNVWGIGRIAWNLIVNRFEKHGPVHEDDAVDPDTDGPLPISKRHEAN